MTVSAGDAVGFFIPRGGKEGLRVAWPPVSDYRLLRGMQSSNGNSPVATFSDSPATLNSSPLVSVIFVKCTWYLVVRHVLSSVLCIYIYLFIYTVVMHMLSVSVCKLVHNS